MQSYFENHLNPVMLVFLHHFVLAKLATSSIRVNYQDAPYVTGMICNIYCREMFQRGGLALFTREYIIDGQY